MPVTVFLEPDIVKKIAARSHNDTGDRRIRTGTAVAHREILERYFMMMSEGEEQLQRMFSPEELQVIGKVLKYEPVKIWLVPYIAERVSDALRDYPAAARRVLVKKIKGLDLTSKFALMDCVERLRVHPEDETNPLYCERRHA